MVALLAGTAVAALATSQGYNYTGGTEEGFVKVANSELNTAEYENHHEQRIKFTVPSLQTVFKASGKYLADCTGDTLGKGLPKTSGMNCFRIAFVPDKKFTRPIYFHKQKLVRFTGNKNIQKWTYNFGDVDYNVCMNWASGPVRSSDNMSPSDSAGFSAQEVLPYDGKEENFEDLRNSPVGEPNYPSIFGRYYDPSTMISWLNHRNLENIPNSKIISLNDLPMINIAMFRCEYDDTKLGSITNPSNPVNGPDLNSGEIHQNAFLNAIPPELGFEYVATTESKTVEEMMSASPKAAPYSSPSTIEILSISIGSVALAIGLGFLVSMKCSGRIVGRTADNFM